MLGLSLGVKFSQWYIFKAGGVHVGNDGVHLFLANASDENT